MVWKPNLYWDIMRCQNSSLRVQGGHQMLCLRGKELRLRIWKPALGCQDWSLDCLLFTRTDWLNNTMLKGQWASLWLCMCLFKEKLLKWYKKLQNPVANLLSLQQRGKLTHNVKLKRWDDKHLHMKKIESVISLNNKPLQVGLCLII